ncbi:MAG: OadG family transporter subunit [Planctomycetota bacterium]
MIGNAVMLMFVGMGVVYIFLVLLNLVVSLLAYCTREHTRKEESALAEEELARRRKKKKGIDARSGSIQTAVISAAVHAYRSA